MVGDREAVGCKSRVNWAEQMDAVVDNKARTGWQHELYDLLRKHDITQIA